MVEIPDSLVRRARGGDLDAFGALLEVLEKPVFQTVYRLVGGRFAGDVEDISQEIFLKIFRSLERFDPTRGVKFSTWIFTFVKNHCFDVLKKRRLRTVSMSPADGAGQALDIPEPQAQSVAPLSQLLDSELGGQIEAAVERLPDDQRLVFVLREYQHLDYQQIAEVAGCSEGTVKSRLYRAKEALRNGLKRYVLR